MIYFISGHLDLTEEEFNEHYKPLIDNALAEGAGFVVGDARGADYLAQQYLHGVTDKVTVYHMLDKPRNNVGFGAIGTYQSDNLRDMAMTAISDADIAWVRPGREKSGTQKNIDRRKKSEIRKI